MKNRERKQLIKTINKYYHLYGFMYQRLYVNACEVMDKNSSSLDIHLWDEKKKEYGPFLFIVQNYNGFKGAESVPRHSYFRPYKIIETWDGVRASYSPLFMNMGTYNLFTLPKFTGITKEDVVNCTKYFCKVILNDYWIWNVNFGTDKLELDNGQKVFEWGR